MTMTKKDYELIANVINGRLVNSQALKHFSYTDDDISLMRATLKDLTFFMASELGNNDPKFDRKRFTEGCGF